MNVNSRYINNGFNPKIAQGKDIPFPSKRQVNRARMRLLKTLTLIKNKKN